MELTFHIARDAQRAHSLDAARLGVRWRDRDRGHRAARRCGHLVSVVVVVVGGGEGHRTVKIGVTLCGMSLGLGESEREVDM